MIDLPTLHTITGIYAFAKIYEKSVITCINGYTLCAHHRGPHFTTIAFRFSH